MRESGSIEQDADVVLLLAKPKEAIRQMQKVVSKKDLEEDSEPADESFQDTVVRDLILAKQRNGPVGTVRLTYCKPYTRFENYTAERA